VLYILVLDKISTDLQCFIIQFDGAWSFVWGGDVIQFDGAWSFVWGGNKLRQNVGLQT